MHVVVFCDCPVGQPGTNVGGTHAVVSQMRKHILANGHNFTLITGEMFDQIPAGVHPLEHLTRVMGAIQFDTIHIITPMNRLGLLSRQYCIENNLAFTMTYDTQIPEYLEIRHGVPQILSYAFMRWFARPAKCVIVPTPTMKRRLESWGFINVVANGHGVDTDLFQPLSQSSVSNPETASFFATLQKPVLLYVGRISREKNPQAFLKLRLGGKPHSKVVVGDLSGGMTVAELQAIDPQAHFVGVKTGAELADYFKLADVFVFPSKTDTFGLVMLEALASGTPVAAYPTIGTSDVITSHRVGCLDEDLEVAVARALTLRRRDCRQFTEARTWERSIAKFASHLTNCHWASYTPRDRETWADIPPDQLRHFAWRTAMMLWADEPAGPYDPNRTK